MNRNPQRHLQPARTYTVSESEELLSAQSLVELLEARLMSPQYQPPMLPAVAREAMALSSKPDVEMGALAALVEKDPLLTTRVLQVCRSPVYARAMQLRSIKSAVVALGIKTVRNIVMEVSLNSRVFRSVEYGPALERLARHGSVVALLARTIARFTSFDPEWAYLCGLLHDVGISAALVAMGEVPRGEKARPLEEVWMAVDSVHERAAGVVARRWTLPEELALVVSNHHTVKVQGMAHPMAAVICLADMLAFDWGEGPDRDVEHGRIDAPAVASTQLARSTLGFQDDRPWQQVEKAAREALQLLRSTPPG